MKQTLRKILAILVVFSIVLSIGVVAFSGSAAGQFTFEDTFEDGELTGWKNTTGNLSNGVYNVGAYGTNTVTATGASNLTDYTVEADVTPVLTQTAPDASKTVFIGIVGRTTNAGSNGYEFTLRFNRTQEPPTLNVGLYRRGTSPSGATADFVTGGGEKSVKSIFGGSEQPEVYTSYHLKMVFAGSSIKCYINDHLAYDVTDENYTSGSAGLTSGLFASKFDNFKITETVESISSDASSATSSAGSTAGNVVYVNEDFTDDSKFAEEGWNTNPTIVDGKALNTTNKTYNLSNNAVVSALQDYVVEADVQMDLNTQTEDPSKRGTVFAGIIGRGSYEMRICWTRGNSTGYIMAHNGTTIKGAGIKYGIDQNASYKLKMVFTGSTVYYYLNGEMIKAYTGETPVAGTAGFKAAGYATTCDNFVVRSATKFELAGQDDPYFFESFDSAENFAAGGWNTTPVTANQMYKLSDGMNDLRKNTVVSGLSDYVVEAEVMMDATTTSTVNTSVTGITARMANGAGYEMLLRLDQSGANNIRIYNRRSDAQVAMIADNIMKNQLQANTVYKLKMLFAGATLKCFVDDQLVYITTATDVAGTVGVRSYGYTGYFNDFTVRKATQEELDATLGGGDGSDTSSGSTSSGSTSSGSTSSGGTSSLPEGVYFQEDFEDQLKQEDGWNTAASVSGGKYKGTEILLTKHNTIKTYRDYAIDVEISVDTSTSTSVGTNVAAIVGRYATVGDKTGGYEIGYVNERDSGKSYLRVYDRVNSDNTDIRTVSLVPGNTYKLTAVFAGTTLKVFLDGTIVRQLTVDDRAGTVGLKRGGYTAAFDNFVVRAATQAELNATLDEGTSSGGNIQPFTPPEGTIFYDDFNDSIKTSDGWNKNAGVNADGKFTATPVYLSNHATVKAMHDYAIDVEIMVDTSGNTGVVTNVAAIVGRYATVGAATGGYEIGYANNRDTGDAYIRVYDRVNGTGKGEFQNVQLIPGVTYKLTAVFVGTTLRVYVDDELIGELQIEDRAGTAGLIRSGYMAYFDNFVVRTPTADEINPPAPQLPEADADGVYYKDSFSNRASFLNSLWSTDFEGIEKGAAILSDDDSTKNYYLTGDKGFFGLTDYTVEAKFTLDPDFAARKNGASITISGRANIMWSGYDFGIQANNGKLSLRLYDRVSGSVNGVNEKTLLNNSALSLETGKQYTLRLVLVGDMIRAYLDQEKVFEWKNTSASKGTAGLRVDGLQGFVDDFVIRKPTAAEIKGEGGSAGVIGGGDQGPGTGDSILYVCIAFCALLAAAVVLQLAKRRKA